MSFAHHPHLVSLRLHLFIAPPVVVAVLRELFVSAFLPSLRHLRIDITLDSGEGNLHREFSPFLDDDDTRRAPILPASIAGVLSILEFRFANRLLTVRNSEAFFDLFGLAHRPGVLQITKDNLMLF
jgi:hypothetical protein